MTSLPTAILLLSMSATVMVAQTPDKPGKQPPNSVFDVLGRPIPGATALILAFDRGWLDSSPHAFERPTSELGIYRSTQPHSYAGTWAFKPGFLPGAADKRGRIVLLPVPKGKLLQVRKGHLRIDAKGEPIGFCFTAGAPAAKGQADLIPVVTKNWQRRAVTPVTLEVQARGALAQIPVRVQSGSSVHQDLEVAFRSGRHTRPPKLQRGVVPLRLGDAWGMELLFVRCRDGKGRALILSSYESRAAHDTHVDLEFEYIYQPDPKGPLVPDSGLQQLRDMMGLATWHRQKQGR